jgi:hypothetical protein
LQNLITMIDKKPAAGKPRRAFRIGKHFMPRFWRPIAAGASMSADQICDQAQPDDELSDGQIVPYRRFLHNLVASQGVGLSIFQGSGFQRLSWDYLLADLEFEARAARIKVPRDGTIGSFLDTVDVLPPLGVLRLMTAYIAYFTPPDNEALVDSRLQGFDDATAKRMRQRRNAVLAAEAVEAKQEEARKEATAEEESLRSQWYACPRATLSTECEDFLRWIKVRTPDTWHVIVSGWDHNCDDRDDVIEWILDQPNCDVGTAAKFFFTAAVGFVGQNPEELSPCYRRKWLQTKRAAENWQRGHYARSDLDPWVESSDMKYYDDAVARLAAEGRPLPWKVPGPQTRRFGARQPDSAYHYEHGYLKLKFEVWKRHRERLGA